MSASWARLADEAIADAAEWKQRARNAEAALRDVSRVLTSTDPSKFSAEDERRRIGTAQVLIAQVLAKVTP